LRKCTCKAHANTHIRTHAHASSILERCSCVADRSRTLTQYHRETDTDTHFFDVLERELHRTIVVAVPHTRLRWATHRCTHTHTHTYARNAHASSAACCCCVFAYACARAQRAAARCLLASNVHSRLQRGRRARRWVRWSLHHVATPATCAGPASRHNAARTCNHKQGPAVGAAWPTAAARQHET
jgi:hypothetical protein